MSDKKTVKQGPPTSAPDTRRTNRPRARPRKPVGDRSDALRGTVVAARYEVLSRLGAGASGSVYEVTDRHESARRALKLLGRSGGHVASEFRALARLDHPGCVKVRELGEDPSLGAFLVLDLVDGVSPDRAVAPGDSPDLLAFARRTCEVLGYLHSNDVVHGDLKPDNIRCLGGDPGRPVLLDFGLASVSGHGAQAGGTPRYMAPELVRGGVPDARSDLYALGVLLYELIAGRPPFPRPAVVDVLRAHLEEPPPPLSLHAPRARAELCELVEGLLAKEPGARPATAWEVLEGLAAIDGARLDVRPPSAEPQLVVGIPGLEARRPILDAFDAHLREVDDRGALMLLSGPPGSGRSRMLAELGVRARLAGATVVQPVTGRRDGRGTGSAVLDAVLIRSGTADAPPGAHGALAEGSSVGAVEHLADRTIALLERLGLAAPLVVLRDDLEAAGVDAGVLRRIARALPELRCVVVAAGDEAAVADLAASGETHDLPPLREAEVARVLEGALGDVEEAPTVAAWLFQESGGAPGMLLDGIRWLVGSGALVRRGGRWRAARELAFAHDSGQGAGDGIAQRRVAALAAEQRHALAVGAVLGRRFEPALVDKVLGAPEGGDGWLLPALASRVVLRTGVTGELTFASRALHAALLRAVPATEAREIHHAAAAALRKRLDGRDVESDARLAHHLIGAGAHEDGVALMVRALSHLRRRGLLEAAGRFARAAVETAEATGAAPDLRAALLAELGEVWLDVDDPERALAAFSRGRELAGEGRLDTLAGREGAALTRLGRYAEAVPLLEPLVGGSGDPDTSFNAAWDLAWSHTMSGRFDAAAVAAAHALQQAEEQRDPRRVARALRLRGTIEWRVGETDAALATAERALGRFQALRDAAEIAFTHLEIGNVHRATGRYSDALTSYGAALEGFERLSNARGIGKCQNNLGVIHYHLGDWRGATACFEAFLRVVDRTGERVERVVLMNNLGTLHRDRGNLERAEALLEQGRQLAESIGATRLLAMVLGNLGETQLRTGRVSAAMATLDEARARSLEVGAEDELLETDRRLLVCRAATAPKSVTAEELEALLERATSQRNALEEANVCALLAASERRRGRLKVAQVVVERGLRAVSPTGAVLEEARLRVEHAEILAAQGDVALARREARAAEQAFSRLDAGPDLGDVRRLMSRLAEATSAHLATRMARFLRLAREAVQVVSDEAFLVQLLDAALHIVHLHSGTLVVETADGSELMRVERAPYEVDGAADATVRRHILASAASSYEDAVSVESGEWADLAATLGGESPPRAAYALRFALDGGGTCGLVLEAPRGVSTVQPEVAMIGPVIAEAVATAIERRVVENRLREASDG